MSAELGESVGRDLDIPGLAAAFRCRTAAGAEQLTARLQDPVSDALVLEKRQEQLRDIKRRLREPGVRQRVAAARATLERTEEAVLSLTTLRTDKRHAEYYTQILWSPESRLFAWLNEQSLFNEAAVFFRTLFLPGLAVLLPLFVFLAPLIIYKFVLRQPLTFAQYRELLGRSLKQAMPSVLGRPRFAGRGGLMEVGEQAVHILVSAGVFIASIWNQVAAARSMRAAVADMRSRAAAARDFTAATRELGAAIGCPVAAPEWPIGDLALFGACWNTPQLPTDLLAAAGELDMLVAVAAKGRTCFPTYSAKQLELTDLFHPGTGAHRVYNSIAMDASAGHHVLLTGPNRGGKSTMLKSLGAAVLMSQTLGVVFARRATVPVFQQIITALAPADVLGEMSLFEAEIEFAKGVRQRLMADSGPMFLMMDEIFHGTNAHDGLEASRVFLDDLYAHRDGTAWSIVSTHYLGLPEQYGKVGAAQTLCMEASRDPVDPERLLYTYRLRPGINELSSVREILRERGLLTGRVPEAEKSSASANKV